jgi:hypothetical protein
VATGKCFYERVANVKPIIGWIEDNEVSEDQ